MYWERSRFRWRSSNAITWSSKSRRQLPTQRSATPFCQGLRIEVRTGVIFRERIDAAPSKPYFASAFRVSGERDSLPRIDQAGGGKRYLDMQSFNLLLTVH